MRTTSTAPPTRSPILAAHPVPTGGLPVFPGQEGSDLPERTNLLVAATALDRGSTVATRYIRHSWRTGGPVLDPSDFGPRKAG